MVARVFGAAEDSHPGVERVSQHRVDMAVLDGLFRELWGRYGGEAALGEFGLEGADGPVPAGVGFEGPRDQGCALLVDGDGPGFAAVFDGAGVEVTDGCASDAATVLDLFAHALDDFVGEVLAVELCDGGHDAVEQDAARGLVDVFGGGDQPDVEFVEALIQGGVVVAVAGEAVDLVDDDVVDAFAFLLQVAEHFLQCRASGGGGGDSAFDEFFDDHRTQ